MLRWKTTGLHVSEPDTYAFPNYITGNPVTWAKEGFAWSNAAFRAGRDLELNYGYHSFKHSEKWTDSFDGWSYAPLQQ